MLLITLQKIFVVKFWGLLHYHVSLSYKLGECTIITIILMCND